MVVSFGYKGIPENVLFFWQHCFEGIPQNEMVLISISSKDVGLLWYHQMLERIMGNYQLKLPYILLCFNTILQYFYKNLVDYSSFLPIQARKVLTEWA